MSDPRAGEHPPRIVLYVAGVGGAVVGGALGGLVGFSVDTQRCERRHRHDPPAFLFGPCFFPPVSGITETGWYAGSSTGATIGAAIVARARGCTTSDAAGGALVGALLGALPAALYLSGNDWKTPNGTRLTLATPVLQGMGAALALQGCRPPAARSRS